MIETNVTYDLEKLAGFFELKGTFASGEPFGSGHINDTFALRTAEEDCPDYVLQRVNHQIFPDVPGVMDNISRVTEHIRKKLEENGADEIDRHVVTVVPAKDGKLYHKDEEGNFWRILVLVPDSKSYDIVTTEQQAFEGGKAFGQFQTQLADLPGGPLVEILPNFHNVVTRFATFEENIAKDPVGRVKSVEEEITFLRDRFEEMKTIHTLGQEGKIPVRVTHNDTKFNNVLLDSEDKALCVVDLDTIMPGYVHFDFGDSIRTTTNTGAEDDPNLDNISMNIKLFEAYTKGFLGETLDTLNEVEIEHLALSAKLLTYIMGLRFLTDYIDGDNYYKIAHKEHNIQRARAQFKLLKSMEEQFEEMQAIIRKIAGK
ncbi:hypothetical protein FUAX_31520 [Fulvitalea axinellae]|uniref:Aminoglycoside phosphotransferase domain-containing protein n=1 Tax=Fulvitalea axinellae TaxID=1182444 RepID=A0AAU9DHY3_9BACT|nr:hypothetical protein FUAX_31520 [Fulvitalea axinellae]